MLIIAIPKSASTSLLHTLSYCLNIEGDQDISFGKELPHPEDFPILSKYHSDCREINAKQVDRWGRTDHFYKQHIAPTRSNLNLLVKTKKVILLREPEEVILAYRRAELKKIHDIREEFVGCNSDEKWLKKAREIGLFKELKMFQKKWENDPTEKFLIFYDELISDPEVVINKIAKYFNLITRVKDIKLQKMRYSKHNQFQSLAYKAIKKLKKILHGN